MLETQFYKLLVVVGGAKVKIEQTTMKTKAVPISTVSSQHGNTTMKHQEHTVTKFDVKTPIGLLKIKSCEKGLHWISLGPHDEGDDSLVEESLDVKQPQPPSDKSHVAVFEWMQEYFRMTNNENPELVRETSNYPPICWDGLGKTEFEINVYKTALENIKFGQTVSYSQLAEMVNNPRASRAVGTALKNNPIIIIVPCHRIIRSDGSFGKYAGGAMNGVKEWLIHFEKEN